MKGMCNSGILRVAALLAAIMGWCDARAGQAFAHVSVGLTIIESCTVNGAALASATDIRSGRASSPVQVACSGSAAPSVTFARVPRAMAFAADIAPSAGEGVFHAERADFGGESVVRATVTF